METIKIWPGWEIKEQIGEGDLGKVFRIERTDAGITGEAALKVIEISGDSSEIKMFRKMGMDEDSILEIYEERKNQLFASVARLSCLRTAYGIASVEDFDSFWNEEESSWTILIRSEYLESLDAYGKKKGGDLFPEEIAEMGRDIAGALMTLEKEGITTLSVKPSNILRNSEGAYKLSDAGVNEGTGRLAASKVGTLFSWDAPELVRSGNYDRTSDIYSLGMVMYVLLNGGKRPFMEEGGVLKRWMQFRMANERRVSGEPLPKPVSGDEELQKIVLKACAPRPEDRYQTAQELRDALEIWLFGQKYGKRFFDTAAVSAEQQGIPENADNAGVFEDAQPVPAAEAEPFPETELKMGEAETPFESAAAEIPFEPQVREEGTPFVPGPVEAEIPSVSADLTAAPFSASWEPAAETFPAPAEESAVEEEPEQFADIFPAPAEESAVEEEPKQFADMQEESLTAAEGFGVEEEIGGAFSEGVMPILPEDALEKSPAFFGETDSSVTDQNEEESDPEGIQLVKAEPEDYLSDAVHADSYGGISLFKKTEDEPENDTDIVAENPSVPVWDEGVHEKELNPFPKDLFSEPEPFDLQKEPTGEPWQSSEELFHSPDLFDSSEEKGTDQEVPSGMNSFTGWGDDSEVTALVSDEDRQVPDSSEPFFDRHESQGDKEKSLDDSISAFFSKGADLDDEEQKNEDFPVEEVSQQQPEIPGSAPDIFFGGEAFGQSQNNDPYGVTTAEVPASEAAPEEEKKEIPPTADVFMYIFQRDDRKIGIHSLVSENGGGARLKMKSDILETGLFEAILNNLRDRTTLPITNAYVTIGSGATKEEYEERKEMVRAAGLESVTVLDDAAVNALGIFGEELGGSDGEHYVLSVIHDYNGFHSSLLKFDRSEGSAISVLKSSPTARVVNPMENPAFTMDRMLQDNCRVDGVDYSERIERILVDNRNRPLYGSVGQGSFDPYYNEVYGSIFRRAALYEGIEALKGLIYYDSCKKEKKDAVRISLSVFEEPVEETPAGYPVFSRENGPSAQDDWMGFGADNGAAHRGSDPDFRTDPERDMADPNFSTMESTMVGTDPFANGGGSSGSGQDPFGAGSQMFGSSQDPFGAGSQMFGSSQDPFGAGGQTSGSSQDSFGAGGQTSGSSSDPFGADGDMFNETVSGENNYGQTNGNAAFGRNPFGDELTADGFGGNALDDTSAGNSHMNGFGENVLDDTSAGSSHKDGIGGMPDNKAGVPSGISYSDRGRIYLLNEKKPIKDVTMEVNDGGIDLFRKDMKITLAFGMIGSAIEGKGRKFAHIDFSQIRGFGYETPNTEVGPKPALYTTDGKVYTFDFVNAEGTENILRQIAGASGRPF